MFPRSIASSLGSIANQTVCLSANDLSLDESTFFQSGSLNWDAHRIGWAIAGGCALLTTIISGTNIWLHCRNYRKKLEQRQIVRILLMPVVFSIISFAGYRFFRTIVYYQVVRNTYEAFTIAAFMILMLCFLAESPVEQREVLSKKEKRKLVFPFCCLRYRPSKPYFLFTVKWSVMQFVILKPLISIAAIVTEALGVFCATSQSPHFANVWLEAIDFFSVSVALYGLITLYSLTHEELKGHRPLAKFMTIKIIVALVFYQGFVFTILEKYGVIKATEFWTATNVSNGLNALVTTMEMVLIALFQLYAFPVSEYKLYIKDDRHDAAHTSFWASFLHSQNYSDFLVDIGHSLKFFFDRMRGKAYTKAPRPYSTVDNKFDLAGAFGFDHPSETKPDKTERPYLATSNSNQDSYFQKDNNYSNAYPPSPSHEPRFDPSQQRQQSDSYAYPSFDEGTSSQAGNGAGRQHGSSIGSQALPYRQLPESSAEEAYEREQGSYAGAYRDPYNEGPPRNEYQGSGGAFRYQNGRGSTSGAGGGCGGQAM